MLLTPLVVEKHLALDGVLYDGFADEGSTLLISRSCCYRSLQGVVSSARIAVGKDSDLPQQVVGNDHWVAPEASFFILQSAIEEGNDLVGRERREHVDLGTGKQGRVDLKRGVLGSGANQHYVAALHVGQECVLLRLVEAMDLVNEEDGTAAIAPVLLGSGHDV